MSRLSILMLLCHIHMSLFACCFAFTSTLYAYVTIRTSMHVHADTNMQTHVYTFVNFHLQNIECLCVDYYVRNLM